MNDQLADPAVPDERLDLPEDDPPPGYDARNLRRCPTCGAMVYLWPCLACHMKAQARPLPLSAGTKPGPGPTPTQSASEGIRVRRSSLACASG